MTLDLSSLQGNPDLVRLNPDILAPAPKMRRAKYGNIRTEYKGRVYASKREAARARVLDSMVPSEIVAWFPQVPFILPGGIKYYCDFLVVLPDGMWRAEDAKGVKTDVYKLKRRLFRETYDMEIVEV